jgi:hypothetical protein
MFYIYSMSTTSSNIVFLTSMKYAFQILFVGCLKEIELSGASVEQ